jgi:hypothetical protein
MKEDKENTALVSLPWMDGRGGVEEEGRVVEVLLAMQLTLSVGSLITAQQPMTSMSHNVYSLRAYGTVVLANLAPAGDTNFIQCELLMSTTV